MTGSRTLSALKKKDLKEWKTLVDEDLHMAWQAHAEDNAPGVERALARLEATLIQLNGNVAHDSTSDAHASDESTTEPYAQERVLHGQDDIPFVDLTVNGDNSEQE